MKSFNNSKLGVFIATTGIQWVKINSSIMLTKRVNIYESQISPKGPSISK
jgi:hypothetical protein